MILRSVLAALAISASAASAAPGAAVDVPFQSFRLDNGLTVIVHEDRKAPIVAVNLWYHVGGKDEPADRTEFAHLYEHLMFQGTEHYNDEWFKAFDRIGATDLNGTTDQDRTNYFQNVPSTALDMALWMESDRMGHLLGVIDQARLDEQREVVQNEKRQRDNQPYGAVWDLVFAASFPLGHPYHDPMGDASDLLKGATLDEVKDWFRQHYGAANAVLVLAGDIDLATAREKVAKYFAHIPAGPPQSRHGTQIAARRESSRATLADRVAQTRIVRSWNVPEFGSADMDRLALASQVLGGSAASRLDARLVYRDQLVDSVGTFTFGMEIAGLFVIQADVKQGVDPRRVEAALDEELARLMREGPGAEELARAKTQFRASFVRGIERIGGFGGKADALAECYVYTGDAGCFRQSLARIEATTAQDLKDTLKRWLAQGDYTLTIVPFGEHRNTEASAVDRSTGMPEVTTFPDLRFPALERTTLRNGMKVVLAQRHEIPVVGVQILFDAGFASDGAQLGRSSFAMQMLDEGAGKRDALAFKARAEELGAQLWSGSAVDTSDAGVSALTDQLDPSLGLLADLLRRPRFEPADIERVRKQWLAGIAQEKTRPQSVALRLLPPLLYGEGHPYAMPFTGSGTEASIAALTREGLQGFHREWLRPEQAIVLVVGDTTLAAIVPLLEKHFGDWKSQGTAPAAKRVPAVALPEKPRVFLVDKPGAQQSTVIAGLLAPPPTAPNHLELGTVNTVLGGSFISRLNLNLREDKHWSYGVGSQFGGALAQRPFLVSAPVQTDKTAESIAEVQRELAEIVGKRPITAKEIRDTKDNDIRALPGQFETSAAVLGSMRSLVLYGRPDDYVTTLRARLEAQDEAAIQAAARELVRPQQFTWVIVGDLSKIETGIRALDLGEVQVLDADGKRLR